MKKKFWRIIVIIVSCGVVFYGGIGQMNLSPIYAQIEPPSPSFLHPPYYGATSVNAVFDHEFPVYAREADEQYLNCANNRDPNLITTTVFHYNGVRYPSDTVPSVPYSGHDGIDFGLNHDYVLATHDGIVTEARWFNPQNRRASLGLYTELRTADQVYRTRYGHMSALLVKKGDAVNQQQVIGISGNTGRSTGPHLHFSVRANNIAVNPYGWAPLTGVTDPWHCVNQTTASQPLWEILPAITNDVYPSGPGLPFPSDPTPPLTPNFNYPNLIIDDLNERFRAYGSSWKMRGCDDWFGACFGTTYFSNGDPATSTYAVWQLTPADLLGFYDVYAFIPREHANTSLAYYEIHHSGQILSAGIDQSRFNQNFGANSWAYLGQYNFSELEEAQAVRVYHTAVDNDQIGVHESLGADALVFVRADGPPHLTLSITEESNDAGINPHSHPDPCEFRTDSPEIYFGYCHDKDRTAIVSGWRYANVDIPAEATIIRAHLEFVVDGTYEVPLQLRIYGDSNPASPTFTEGDTPQDRSLTEAGVTWGIPAKNTWVNFTKRVSPNLAPIVQELVNDGSWTQGQSALTFIIKPASNPNSDNEGNEHRRVMAYERGQNQPSPPPPGSYSARLLIWYEE